MLKAQENQYVPEEWIKNESVKEDNIEKIREKAILLLQENQYHKALLILDNIITHNKGNAEDFYLRGQCNEHFENQLIALNDYRSASNINSNYSEAIFSEANLLLLMERFAEVIPLIDRLLMDTLSENVETKMFLFKINQQGVDIGSFQTLNQKQSSYKALLYFFKAHSYFGLKQFQKALESIEKTISYQLNNHDAWILKGLIYKNLNQKEESKKCFEYLLQVSPQNAKALFELSLLDEKDKAREKIDKALENESFAEGYFQRAMLKFDNSEFRNAKMDFDSVLILEPTHYEAFLNRGLCYSTLKMYSQALSDFQKAIMISPENPKGYNCKANTYIKIKDFEKAIQNYETSLEIDALQSNVYFNMGIAYQGLKNRQKACEYWQKATQLGSLQAKEVVLKKCQD
jgi:tetratricopeptide (TPR) repeat protein